MIFGAAEATIAVLITSLRAKVTQLEARIAVLEAAMPVTPPAVLALWLPL